tara:strand:- start:147 stop:287 length:141 start_codon:yes stop_codon:yes gene_type:complete
MNKIQALKSLSIETTDKRRKLQADIETAKRQADDCAIQHANEHYVE